MHIHFPGFASTPSGWEIFIAAFVAYVLVVHFQRYERARSLERKYAPAGRSSFSTLTTNDAQAILRDLIELEFPRFLGFSIIFALFKVSGKAAKSTTSQLTIARRRTAYLAFPLF